MLVRTIVPIPKNKRKSFSNSNNYRSLALNSVVGKVTDKMLLNTKERVFQTCNLLRLNILLRIVPLLLRRGLTITEIMDMIYMSCFWVLQKLLTRLIIPNCFIYY